MWRVVRAPAVRVAAVMWRVVRAGATEGAHMPHTLKDYVSTNAWFVGVWACVSDVEGEVGGRGHKLRVRPPASYALRSCLYWWSSMAISLRPP